MKVDRTGALSRPQRASEQGAVGRLPKDITGAQLKLI